MCAEHLMQGFPPNADAVVNVGNWQDPPFNRWAFGHMREVLPTQSIPRGPTARSLPVNDRAPDLEAVAVQRVGSGAETVARVLAETFTDAVLILHRGQVVLERYPGPMDPDAPHLLMSVSKSLVGSVAGILTEQGHLDPDREAQSYVPEVAASGYGGARVRDILDMRTGVKFSEDYTDPESEVRQMEPHMGWRPGLKDPTDGTYAYLARLGAEGAHGGAFHYRSADADMLGWICERAAGARMAELLSTLLWGPMGAEYDAEVTCDSVGTAIHDGGVSARTRDLARFGQLVLDNGAWGDRQVLPTRWLRHTRTPDQDIRAAFAASEHEPVLPGGWYRNQFWLVPGVSGTVQLALGIHGQMLLVDHETSTVAVKFSTWPQPQNPALLIDTIRAFCAVGRRLAGLADTRRAAAAVAAKPLA